MEPITELPQINGTTALIVLVAINVVVKCGEILWRMKQHKDLITEKGIERLSASVQQNTHANEKLAERMEKLERALASTGKMKLDLRRLYTAVKRIAGAEWPDIRKEIMEDDEVSQ